MKYLVTLAMTGLMAILLTGCGQQAPKQPAVKIENTAAPAPAAEPAAEPVPAAEPAKQ